jgi:hypothetical protein
LSPVTTVERELHTWVVHRTLPAIRNNALAIVYPSVVEVSVGSWSIRYERVRCCSGSWQGTSSTAIERTYQDIFVGLQEYKFFSATHITFTTLTILEALQATRSNWTSKHHHVDQKNHAGRRPTLPCLGRNDMQESSTSFRLAKCSGLERPKSIHKWCPDSDQSCSIILLPRKSLRVGHRLRRGAKELVLFRFPCRPARVNWLLILGQQFVCTSQRLHIYRSAAMRAWWLSSVHS